MTSYERHRFTGAFHAMLTRDSRFQDVIDVVEPFANGVLFRLGTILLGFVAA